MTNKVCSIKLVGYDLLGNKGEEGKRYAWRYLSNPIFVESASFRNKSKLNTQENNDICGYTTSVNAGCILRVLHKPCAFCRTGNLVPFSGILSAWDIVKQNLMMVLLDVESGDYKLANSKREFAYMGQGEPGYSYPQIRLAIKFTDMIMKKINQTVYRHLISTSGIEEMIEAYKSDLKNKYFDSRVNLHFSLHATKNRSLIMPINDIYPYQNILQSLQSVYDISGEKPSVAVIIFNNFTAPQKNVFNFSTEWEDIKAICDYADPQKIRINLCEFNSSEDICSAGEVNTEFVMEIKSHLEKQGYEVKLFSSFGQEKKSACGMLAGKQPDTYKSETITSIEQKCESIMREIIGTERNMC